MFFSRKQPERLFWPYVSTAQNAFEEAIERSVGRSIADIRRTPLAELHDELKDRPFDRCKLPPHIHFLGDIFLRDSVITTQELDARISRIIDPPSWNPIMSLSNAIQRGVKAVRPHTCPPEILTKEVVDRQLDKILKDRDNPLVKIAKNIFSR